MDMIKWYKYVVFKNYANFNGRASRAEFWWFVLANIIIIIILEMLDSALGTVYALTGLYQLAILVPNLAVGARRLQDIGKSGWNLLWMFVPIVGPILLLIWFIQAGETSDNKYGPVPPTAPPEE